jgi:hypothetical protein
MIVVYYLPRRAYSLTTYPSDPSINPPTEGGIMREGSLIGMAVREGKRLSI